MELTLYRHLPTGILSINHPDYDGWENHYVAITFYGLRFIPDNTQNNELTFKMQIDDWSEL